MAPSRKSSSAYKTRTAPKTPRKQTPAASMTLSPTSAAPSEKRTLRALLGESWRTLWEEPLSFLPIAYSIAGVIILLGVFVALAALFFGNIFAETTPSALDDLAGIGLFVLLLILALFFFAVHARAVTGATFLRIAKRSPLTIKEAFVDAGKNYWRVCRLVLATILLFLPLLVGIIYIVANILSFSLSAEAGTIPDISQAQAGSIIGVFLLVLAGAIFLGAWLYFSLPILFSTDLGAWKIIGRSWKLLWDDAKYVWGSFFLAVGLYLAYQIVKYLLGIPFGIDAPEGGVVMPWWFSVIDTVLTAILATWLSLFVFKAYHAKHGADEKKDEE